MTNPTPGTQLARVLDLMLDGQWRSPAEIAQATGDREASTTSRIRDLRLTTYGGHRVESRKRNVTRQIWEYRLVPPVAPAPFNSWASMNGYTPVSTQSISIGNPAPSLPHLPQGNHLVISVSVPAGPPVKFLNMDTMQVEQISRNRCKVDSGHGFDRVVATDTQGNVLDNLVTTQCDL